MGTGSTSSSTSLMVMSVSTSMPFATEQSGTPGWRRRFASMATLLTTGEGTAKTTSSAPFSARARSWVAPRVGGRARPGR